MILPKEEVLKYLDCVKSLQKVCPLIDIHVSPFEVIFNSFHYVPSPYYEGVHSLDSGRYRPPSVGPLKVEARLSKSSAERHDSVPAKLSLMLYRQFYAHIGPRVLGDHMRLSGISRSLLLPVVHADSDGEEQFRLMFKIYSEDRRFILGYCIPNTVSNKDILPVVKAAVSKYRIGAIKLHPNITEINLSAAGGKKRVENILEACRVTGLPLIIHGGISPVLKNRNSRGYASLSNLRQIDWSITSAPVVISHAGIMGHSLHEISDLMPLLRGILSTHSSVMVDISALDLSALCLVLEKIDRDRIVFGSDAFYFPQWSAVVKLLHALKATVSDTEEAFIKIAGENPAQNVFREQELC
jgi:predicted TIM-barrel fold metal-dependent hydrolase